MENICKIVYIIGTFPSLTMTFIDREVRTLRQWGVDLQVVSVRKPAPGMPLSLEQRQLQQGVLYLLPVKWWSLILGNLYFALFRFRVYVQTLFYLATRPHPDLRSRWMTWLHFAEGVYAAHLLRKRSFDQLHAHFADRAATVALVASRLLGIPYSLTAHANDIYVKPVLLCEKMSEARFVTTCTRYNYTHLLRLMGEGFGNKLHLVYHGLDLTRYRLVSSFSTRDRPLLLSVGRLTEKKGFAYLIDACGHLKNQGYDFECHIIGEGPLRPELEQQIDRLRLQDRVTLCGALAHEAVVDKYREATLFVLPCIVAEDGDRDGIPNVLIEAMAMQLPVVSTYHSSIPELVEDGTSGFLVPPKDKEALAEALVRLLDNRALCTELGQNGREKVLKDFDLDKNAKHMFNLFLDR
jgi:glycosyltransferase involved in cell wall biosynthesis